jgi:uncharacterized CHY-type Zn-finger protein
MAQKIYGKLIDDNTRCTHYHSVEDIIAIKLKCCNKYYACIECHNELEEHEAIVWDKNEFETLAIICGNCSSEISIKNYFDCDNQCPSCKSLFNPKCINHYHLYFKLN